jgi:hypothetical protein
MCALLNKNVFLHFWRLQLLLTIHRYLNLTAYFHCRTLTQIWLPLKQGNCCSSAHKYAQKSEFNPVCGPKCGQCAAVRYSTAGKRDTASIFGRLLRNLTNWSFTTQSGYLSHKHALREGTILLTRLSLIPTLNLPHTIAEQCKTIHQPFPHSSILSAPPPFILTSLMFFILYLTTDNSRE